MLLSLNSFLCRPTPRTPLENTNNVYSACQASVSLVPLLEHEPSSLLLLARAYVVNKQTYKKTTRHRLDRKGLEGNEGRGGGVRRISCSVRWSQQGNERGSMCASGVVNVAERSTSLLAQAVSAHRTTTMGNRFELGVPISRLTNRAS